jgi:transcriptional regulator with XRE-family HTH domain
MHHFPYPSYLRTHRDRWALSQSELGALLVVSDSTISKYEKLSRTPSLEAVIGAEFIFGEPARRLFPSLYATIEAAITLRAIELAEKLGDRADKKSLVKRELLEAIARRAASDAPHV